MRRILVWDLPVRLFHWTLAGSFVTALAAATLADDESAAFALHMLLGGVMAFVVLLRLVWGLVGTRWARFRSFAVSPKALLAYVRGALAGGGPRYTGHNPGTSIAALLMFALVLGLGLTGVMMANGGGDGVEGVHEFLAWAMVAVIGAHVVGIAWHTLRHRENIALSMVDGRKEAAPSGAIRSARPWAALAFVGLTALWTAGLVGGYDGASGRVTLPVIGQTLEVGEGAEHDDGEGRRARGGREEDDRDDDGEDDD
jgi:cytochrome b